MARVIPKAPSRVGKRTDLATGVGLSVDAPAFFEPESKTDETVNVPPRDAGADSRVKAPNTPEGFGSDLQSLLGGAGADSGRQTDTALAGLGDLTGASLGNVSRLGQFGGADAGGGATEALDIPEMKRILRKLLRSA